MRNSLVEDFKTVFNIITRALKLINTCVVDRILSCFDEKPIEFARA